MNLLELVAARVERAERIKSLVGALRVIAIVLICLVLAGALLSQMTVTSQCKSHGGSYCQRWETTIEFKQ